MVGYLTSGQSNLTTGRIAAAHGRFSWICQVAPVLTSPNTCFLESTHVQIPKGISIGSAAFGGSLLLRQTMLLFDRRIGRIYVHITAIRPENICKRCVKSIGLSVLYLPPIPNN